MSQQMTNLKRPTRSFDHKQCYGVLFFIGGALFSLVYFVCAQGCTGISSSTQGFG